MIVAYKKGDSIATEMARAKEAEAAGDLRAAEKIYLHLIKRDANSAVPYNRLMIIYRKQKEYARELSIIEEAIRNFTLFYSPKAAHNKTVKNLSARINRAFGMVDKKGQSVYDPGPVASWKKRKTVVQKRLGK